MLDNNVDMKKVIDYVKGTYRDDYARKVATSLLTEYDLEKVKYAVDNNMDLFDLDRWEYAAKLHKDSKLKGMLAHIGFHFSDEELSEYISDAKKFCQMIVDPLWDIDYEIMELEAYQKLEFMKREDIPYLSEVDV